MDDQRTNQEDRRISDQKWAYGCLQTVTFICAGGIIFPIIIFVATHKMHPANEPGGFGEGYENLFDLILYGIVVGIASIGLLLCAILWAIEAIYRRRKK
jgi:hypothetical protein